MKIFILHWLNGKTETVKGDDLADACQKAGINAGEFPTLIYFEEEGKKFRVAGEAPCGCFYHAEQGLSCSHDLERVGLSYPCPE